MNQDYIVPNNWSIIEEGFEATRVKSSESLFSIGNGSSATDKSNAFEIRQNGVVLLK